MVLTGTNRLRGTSSRLAPAKLSIAAPMALSSWTTGVESESRGSTVLRLTINGRSSTPRADSKVSCRARRSTHRLLVL